MSHLTFDERVRICLLLTEGYRQNEIAARLNRSPSTISRELCRNRHPSGVNSNPKRNFFLSRIRAIIFHIAKAD